MAENVEIKPDESVRLAYLDGQGMIAEPLRCVSCGYLLLNLSPHHACPECGKEIWHSIEARRPFRHVPDWLHSAPNAAILLAVSPVLLPFFGLGFISWSIGAVLFASGGPYQTHWQRNLQKIVFPSLGLLVVGLIGLFVINFGNQDATDTTGTTIFTGMILAGTLVHFFALYGLVFGICWLADWARLSVWTLAMQLVGAVLPLCIFGIPFLSQLELVDIWEPSTEFIFEIALWGAAVYTPFIVIFWATVAYRMSRIRRDADWWGELLEYTKYDQPS